MTPENRAPDSRRAADRDEATAIRRAVHSEIAKREQFSNLHGITIENLERFLVAPFVVLVDPDDLMTQARRMWVVLQESADPKNGHVIVYDPDGPEHWGVAEHDRDGEYVLVAGESSLAKALDAM
jgi:hypothetical protein